MKKEQVYIYLRGKSKEYCGKVYDILNTNGEKTYVSKIKMYIYSNGNEKYHLSDGIWTDGDQDKAENKQEVTIEQLKETLQPMGTFTPIAMRCTQEQFEAIKPKLKGFTFESVGSFNIHNYLVNNGFNKLKNITNVSVPLYDKNRTVYEEWNEEIFLKACGIKTENLEQNEILQPMENKGEFEKLFNYAKSVDFKISDLAVYINEEISFDCYSQLEGDEPEDKALLFALKYKDIDLSLEQQLQKAEAEVERLKEEINKPKVGDWAMLWEDDEETPVFGLITDVTDFYLTCNGSWEYAKKITNKQLIELLENESRIIKE